MLLAISAVDPGLLNAQDRKGLFPPGAGQCNLSIPIRIELVPVDGLPVGQTAHFEARIKSDTEPALVQKMWVETRSLFSRPPPPKHSTTLEPEADFLAWEAASLLFDGID
jgi:hypothetical protein